MDQSKEEFLRFLKETLIPDLRASGTNATAASFHAAVLFIQGAKVVKIHDSSASVVQ